MLFLKDSLCFKVSKGKAFPLLLVCVEQPQVLGRVLLRAAANNSTQYCGYC